MLTKGFRAAAGAVALFASAAFVGQAAAGESVTVVSWGGEYQKALTKAFYNPTAEKVCGSKPVHAAKGYYDDMDAAISFHPAYLPALANTVVWDTHCGCYWSKVYTFECDTPETWSGMGAGGAPVFGEEAKAFAREIQKNLDIAPMDDPFLPGMSEPIAPAEAEAEIRAVLPPWQLNYTSDDYVDYTWHAPTVRLFIGRPRLRGPEPGYQYPAWVWNALGGHAPSIDPMVSSAARCIGATIVDLACNPESIEKAQAEFDERTGGGINGSKWAPPQLPKDFAPPVNYRWPEYVTTPRGEEWWIPEGA